ncbi:hypothetical protein BT96DRAFT_1001981 [Gymnopus androsaceus JB14]|uniref:F-box domain-containing protein n=1 Tax=Gymnopus androsaceus JB14 TaxID=1447944 RepID=A0A6A4H0Q5_9AGAR|nr:hypothetical protein BT96DRAFT_1001981 [Gymnopus androsaceus JB14]
MDTIGRYAKDIGIVSLRKVELRLENEEPDEDVLDELRPLKALRNQGSDNSQSLEVNRRASSIRVSKQMRCENCKLEITDPRVSVNSIQNILRDHRGRGTLHLDRSKVEQVLKDGEKDLEEFSTEILRLQSRLMFLEHRRDRLQSHLRAYGSLISPFSDIIAATNLQATGHCSSALFAPIGDIFALSTPLLWSRINFRIHKECTPALPLLQLSLDLSKEVALELNLSFFWTSDRQAQLAHPACLVIASQAHRWKKLTLKGNQTCRKFRQMPKLCSLTAVDEFTCKYIVCPDFPWHQLTELSLRSCSSIPQFLEACPNLITLHLYLDLDLTYPVGSPVSTIHNKIQSLAIFLAQMNPAEYTEAEDVPSRDVLARVLNQLTIPNLTSFKLASESTWDYPLSVWPPGAMEAFTGFIERSGNNLQILSLTDLYIFHPNLLNILRAVPSDGRADPR